MKMAVDPRRDEGRGDEDGPARLVHRHRVPAPRVRRALPGAARPAAHLRARDALGEGAQGARGGVPGEPFDELFAEHRARRVRGRVDRPGAPRHAARRARRRGQDPVPGRRRGARGRPAKRRHDRAAGAGLRPGPRREGGRRGAAAAGDGGARLRVRGAEPAHLRARLPRPPVHLRARRADPPLAAPGAGHRVRRGRRVRGRQGASRRPSATASARSSSGSASARSTTCSTSTPTRTRATTS